MDDPGSGGRMAESGQWQNVEPPIGAKRRPTVTMQRRWFITVLCGIFFGGVIIGVGGAEGEDDESLAQELASAQQELEDIRLEVEETRARAEDPTSTTTTERAITTTTSEPPTTTTTEATTTTTEPPGFGDGTHQVGTDISPGRYQAPGGDLCYWERLSGFSGELDDIITNDVGTGSQIVEIAETDAAFSSEGCGRWTPVG